MSKVGRKPIPLGNTQVTVDGQKIQYQGKKAEGEHELPSILAAHKENNALYITVAQQRPETKRLWGLHRSLLANKIVGADQGFERHMKIVGLGYKAVVDGKQVEFSLGYSHKIYFTLPDNVSLETDRSGQKLTFSSPDKEQLGLVCSKVRSLRPPEPYKGTGVMYTDEKILRKAGKTKK